MSTLAFTLNAKPLPLPLFSGKKLWEYLKNLGYNDKSKRKGKIVWDIDGELCYDTLSVCNYIIGFFTNIASTARSTQKIQHELGDF